MEDGQTTNTVHESNGARKSNVQQKCPFAPCTILPTSIRKVFCKVFLIIS